MEVMFLLIGVSLLVALFFLTAFIWAVKTGQFDDCHTPAMKILLENPDSFLEEKLEEKSEKGAKKT